MSARIRLCLKNEIGFTEIYAGTLVWNMCTAK